MPELATLFELELLRGHVLGNRGKECVDERVWLPLTAVASIAAVLEACGLKHLPDHWVTPIVWYFLRPNAYLEVIVSTFKHGWHSPPPVPVQAYHVLLELPESIIEGHFVVSSLTFAVTDYSFPIADEYEDAPLVDSIQPGYIRHTV